MSCSFAFEGFVVDLRLVLVGLARVEVREAGFVVLELRPCGVEVEAVLGDFLKSFLSGGLESRSESMLQGNGSHLGEGVKMKQTGKKCNENLK